MAAWTGVFGGKVFSIVKNKNLGLQKGLALQPPIHRFMATIFSVILTVIFAFVAFVCTYQKRT